MRVTRALAIVGMLAMASVSVASAQTLLVTGYDDTGTTADGTAAGPGVAACPASWAFGTTFTVEGYGTWTCHDRYSARLSDRVDLWFGTDAECYQVTRYRNVEILP